MPSVSRIKLSDMAKRLIWNLFTLITPSGEEWRKEAVGVPQKGNSGNLWSTTDADSEAALWRLVEVKHR